MTEDLLGPDYAAPDDLAAIEAVPLEKRGLPESTYGSRSTRCSGSRQWASAHPAPVATIPIPYTKGRRP